MTPVIDAQRVSKWFGEVVAVNNLNVTVEPGVTGLLGPNGAGKTTFIKLCLGLYSPSRGAISICGESPRNNMRIMRRIGYCAETEKFYENMTGYEFVYWMCRLRGLRPGPAKTHAQDAMAFLHMDHRMHEPIDNYSRGMRQRTKIAQVLATDSDLIFLDEPMSGIDPEGREDLFSLIQEWGRQGRTVIFSTHVLYEVERVTNNVLLLYKGCVLAQGEIRQIRELIDEHPHAVTVECRDPHALAGVFAPEPSTLAVEFADGAVTIRTKDPNAFYQKLNDLVMNGHSAITGISCPDDNLQSVFDYLVR